MTRAFIDTNVIVYALLRDPDPRHVLADRLLAQQMLARTLVLSTQVLQETYSVLTAKKRMAPADALAAVRTLADEVVVGADTGFVLRSLSLAQRHRLSVWDALIVQAALDAECTVLYTEDLQDGLHFGELQVVNPFSASAHDVAPEPLLPARKLATSSSPSKRKKAP